MLSVLVGREVEMFELVPKVRQRQCIVVETDRKSVPSRRSIMTERMSSVCWQSNSWNVKLTTDECRPRKMCIFMVWKSWVIPPYLVALDHKVDVL